MPATSPAAQPIRQCVVAERAARPRLCSACPCKALNGVQQLAALLGSLCRIAGCQRVRDAVVHVVVEELEREALERRVHGGDLREDVDAVPVVVDHALDSADLAFDAVEALRQRRFVVTVLHRASRVLRNPRRRMLLVTTKSDEKAIAAAATIGLSSPATASGTAATLYA